MGKSRAHNLHMREMFCQAFVADPKRNAARAAIAAGYSAKSARCKACQLMKCEDIRARIKELEAETLAESGYSPEEVRALCMRTLLGIISTDAADIMQVVYPDADPALREMAMEQAAEADGGQLRFDLGAPELFIKPTEDLTLQERAAVKSIRRIKGDWAVEMHDKLSALKLMAEIAGIKDDKDVNVNVSLVDGLMAARNRAAEEAAAAEVTD